MNRRALLWLAAALLFAGFCALGSWQLRRGAQKEAMLEGAATVLRERRPQPLAAVEFGDPRGYDWVGGHATVQASPLLLLDNQRRGAQVGVRVFAVLHPREGRPLLADFGWLPVPGNRSLPFPALPAGEIEVRGLVAPPPGAGLALGPSFAPVEPAGREPRWLLTRVDLDALSQALGQPLAPRILRLDPALRIGFARDLEVLPNTLPPERHRGYALQWFGLAFATLCTALFMSLRRAPR